MGGTLVARAVTRPVSGRHSYYVDICRCSPKWIRRLQDQRLCVWYTLTTAIMIKTTERRLSFAESISKFEQMISATTIMRLESPYHIGNICMFASAVCINACCANSYQVTTAYYLII